MRFRVAYVAVTAAIAAVDGAYLGGIAAIASCFVTLVLGVLAHRKGTEEGKIAAQADARKAEAEAAAWKILAEQREAEKLELLELLRSPVDAPDEPDHARGRRPRRDRS